MSNTLLPRLPHPRVLPVVFMGMGEPLDNYEAVRTTVRAMCDVRRFSLSPSKIAVSTVGVVPRMLQVSASTARLAGMPPPLACWQRLHGTALSPLSRSSVG
jgi:adenine C2-methylase RlmN of 23S rRNA A2503 and tRNA A37